MGILDFFSRNLFGRGRHEDEEELVAGPMGTKELPQERRRYGRLGGDQSLEDLHKRGEEERADEPEDNREPLGHRPGMEHAVNEFKQEVTYPRHIFKDKTASKLNRLEKGLGEIESAETPSQRQAAERRFRFRMFRSDRGILAKVDSYAEKEVAKLRSEAEDELKKLEKRGASERELDRLRQRFEAKERDFRRDLNRDSGLYGHLRKIVRRSGGSGSDIRPKF